MGIWQFIRWTTNALVIISAQLHDVQKKLDLLIAANSGITQAQLDELAKKLKGSTDSLAQVIEQQKKKG